MTIPLYLKLVVAIFIMLLNFSFELIKRFKSISVSIFFFIFLFITLVSSAISRDWFSNEITSYDSTQRVVLTSEKAKHYIDLWNILGKILPDNKSINTNPITIVD